MSLTSICNSHIILALYLIASPSFAQSTHETISNEGSQLATDEPAIEQLENPIDTDQVAEPEIEQATPQRHQARQHTTTRRDNTNKYLGILGLLFLWLLTRKENSRKEQRSRPSRQAPVTAEELGRAIYSVARSSDLTGFRTLHIDGKEAGEALGVDAATQYLRNRTQAKLTQDIEELSNKLPIGAQYKSCKIEETKITITLITSTGDEIKIDAGNICRVGAVLRLV